MTTHAESPADGRATQNQQLQGKAATLGENWQRQIEEMLQPAVASIQQQVVHAAEQQLEPLRARIQELTGQQLAGTLQDTPHQESPKSPPKEEGASAEKQDAPDQQSTSLGAKEQQDGDSQKQGSSGLRALAQSPTAQLPSRPSSEEEEESALLRWGETLEGAALIVLALGETLEGLALLMQALGVMVGGKPSPQQQEERAPQENEQEEEEGKPSTPEEREEPSLVQKVGDTVSGGVSSVKQAVSHAAGSGSSAQQGLAGVLASLPQWARILEHASALMQALGDSSSSREDGLKKWGPIMKHGAPLVKELGQVLGGGSSSRRGGHGGSNVQRWGQMLGRAASALEALGDGSSQQQDDGKSSAREQEGESSSNQEQEKGSSVKQKLGGVTSTLKDLAGGSSSEKKDDEGGSSLLDALTGEGSPLQMLREFSKRQQGPGGLAPKGPIGRKPPPGPLRRDRLPDAG